MTNTQPSTPGYFDLQALAAYSCCSVRWLRDRLANQTYPLPCYRVEGKILVKREDFDQWMATFRVVADSDGINSIVESVLSQVQPSKRVA